MVYLGNQVGRHGFGLAVLEGTLEHGELPMKWNKLGKIFDPTGITLPNGCVQFAQSPQALVFDDFVRIYFSTRAARPGNGKYLSHIAFVDMDLGLSQSIRVSATERVIPLGGLGCFDEHGIFPMNVVRHAGRDPRVHLRLEPARLGFRRDRHRPRRSADDDGLTFQRLGTGPVAGGVAARALPGRRRLRPGHRRRLSHVVHLRHGLEAARCRARPERVYKIGHAASPRRASPGSKEEARRSSPTAWRRRMPGAADGRRVSATVSHVLLLPAVVGLPDEHGPRLPDRLMHGRRPGDWTRDDERSASRSRPEAGIRRWCATRTCSSATEYLLYNGNDFGRDGFGLAVLE